MDKNFVNIDNLVRQRLGGGEEPERSGSWQKMNALLDKEMPQERPIGGFYWRRFFSAVAVVLFVGTVGVGGYKIATSGKSDTQNAEGQLTAVPGSVALPAGSNEVGRQVSTTGIEHTASVHDRNTAGTAHRPVTNVSNNTPGAQNHDVANSSDRVAMNGHNTNTPADNTNRETANNTNAVTNEVPAQAVNKYAVAPAASSTNTSKNTDAANRNTVARTNIPVKNAAVTTATTQVASVAANNTANNRKPQAHNNNDKVVKPADMAVGSSTAANTTRGNIPAVDNTVTTTNKTGNQENSSNVPVFVTKSGKRIPGDKLQKLNIDKAKQNDHTQTTTVAPQMNKRVIQRMAIVERYIKTEQGAMVTRLDTISVVKMTEELGIITETKTVIPPANKNSVELNAASKNKGMMTNSRAKRSRLFRGATMSESQAERTEANNNNTNTNTKKTSGIITLQNLSAAFNDVKYHMSGMQFAGGITGGINTTFFGPANFKGFQFGLTGNFIFNEKISVMGELKYFNRMSGSSVSDNYYTYTPAASGYTKELQVKSYDFASLQSFEMPVAVRYTQGRLNLFAGGNVSYTFGVNTAASVSADTRNRSVVSTIANDNAPKLTDNDFNSRIGIGYLFGASYQVSPHITLDLRNVQTVWDNSKTSGAKIVSGQLYRMPSLQFSIGYRFGGKKKD